MNPFVSLRIPAVCGLVCLLLTVTYQVAPAEDECLSFGRHDCACHDRGPATLFTWSRCRCCEPDEGDDTIVTDRPDFTEASQTVGAGRVQLEIGYTYFYDNDGVTSTKSQTYPEALWRIGIWKDWLELRIVWTQLDQQVSVGGVRNNNVGSADMQLGFKLALTDQCGVRPAMALIPQMGIPTGDDAFTADEATPGLNWIYSWDLNDCWSVAGSTQGNRVVDGTGHSYVEFAQSATTAVSWTDRWGSYFEWFAFFPHSAIQPGVGAQHFLNGGFTYLISNNMQYDIRAGRGLSDAANDYFLGTGLSIRW